MNSIWEYLASRLQEPSTWVSIGTLLTGVGVTIAPDYWQSIMGIGMGLGGLLGAVLRERKKTTPSEIKAVVEAVVKPEVTVSVSKPQLEAVMKEAAT